MQRFFAGDIVRLKVDKSFDPPPNLKTGAKGVVKQRLSRGDNYRVLFDDRPDKWTLVNDKDLQ